jgi:hypothetical protein
MLIETIIKNKDLLKVIYAFIIGVICSIIVIKTDKLFKLSLHQGIRYFRNAFFFYGLAFITRYFIGAINFNGLIQHYWIVRFLFEFFLIMAGFSLLYSLVWKKFESKEASFSSIFNTKIILFYLLTLILVCLDFLWQRYSFMFVSQMVLFGYAGVISYINYKKDQKQHRFLKFYFLSMILSLFAWILNFIAESFFNWNQNFLIGVYALNITVFLLFLYGVVRVIKK